jgi:hypothetical protein
VLIQKTVGIPCDGSLQDFGSGFRLPLLDVSTAEIQSWLSGKTSPGNGHFLQMLDIVAKGPR